LAIPTSATENTAVTRVDMLLLPSGSDVTELVVAVLLTLPADWPGGMPTTRVNTADAPFASELVLLHDTIPVEPACGIEQVQPDGGVTDWKVSGLTIVSLIDGSAAADGPWLVTVIV